MSESELTLTPLQTMRERLLKAGDYLTEMNRPLSAQACFNADLIIEQLMEALEDACLQYSFPGGRPPEHWLRALGKNPYPGAGR
jgi:hypothetical protein